MKELDELRLISNDDEDCCTTEENVGINIEELDLGFGATEELLTTAPTKH